MIRAFTMSERGFYLVFNFEISPIFLVLKNPMSGYNTKFRHYKAILFSMI